MEKRQQFRVEKQARKMKNRGDKQVNDFIAHQELHNQSLGTAKTRLVHVPKQQRKRNRSKIKADIFKGRIERQIVRHNLDQFRVTHGPRAERK